ncbi:hypothetical protein HF086_010431 [Spodoptera exigua]|uniref:Outer dynein arm-docking complex subunit 4 n=1 Tax=Spodoptera exigua TaxID=7107 RepID=A0A922MTS7_SPOEX|nr:hypothetical protein HF086_010431 [Spodoptera exigua]
MGRGKEPEVPYTNPVEAKKHRDEASGHIKNGNYDRGLNSLAKDKLFMDFDNAKAQARSILGPTKDAEFLQSFVRVGIGDEEEETPVQKASISKRAPHSAELEVEDEKQAVKERKESVKPKKKWKRKPKRERRRREEELYTDKDRAAAVVMGSKDIKQSLNLKDKAERSSALQLPVEADAGTLLALARAEMMRERYRTAVLFVNKAIELAPDEKAAYVARSKCYLLLGEPRSALLDAEAALKLDPKDAKALLRKAEALYYCGEFEMRAVKVVKKAPKKRSKSARPVLGQLNSDKIYLENLLKNPDLAIADKKNDVVMRQAEEAIRFLENREEFWRQQQTTT